MTFSYNPGGGPDEFPNSRKAPPSELTLAYEEIRGLRTEVARLREALSEFVTGSHAVLASSGRECDCDAHKNARAALVPSAPQTQEETP